jgi:hypothetical protein
MLEEEACHQLMRKAEPQLGSLSTPARLMKILEAERWRKSTNPHEVVLLQQQQEEGGIGSTIAQETKSASSLTARSPREKALARILPPTPTHSILAGGALGQASTQSKSARGELTRPWQLRRSKAEALKAKGRSEWERSEGMTATRGMNPFLKADSSARTPKGHEKSPPMHNGAPSL